MANEVYTTEDIILSDGTEVTLRPLPISKMKVFTRKWTEHLIDIMGDTDAAEAAPVEGEEKKPEPSFGEMMNLQQDQTEKQFDVFIDLCVLCLGSIRGDRDDKKFSEYLGDTLDQQTIKRILKVCGALDLDRVSGDPNLLNQE